MNYKGIKIIIPSEDEMIYVYKTGGVSDYLTYNELLRTILDQRGVSPFLDEGRIRLQVQSNKRHDKFHIHTLAYACYYGWIKSLETWERDLQSFHDYRNTHNLQIDHADNNPHNNTIYNLSLMDGTLNKKERYNSEVPPPCSHLRCICK